MLIGSDVSERLLLMFMYVSLVSCPMLSGSDVRFSLKPMFRYKSLVSCPILSGKLVMLLEKTVSDVRWCSCVTLSNS